MRAVSVALLAGAALALEERAGDLPGGVHALLDVHGQREEVDVAQAAGGGGREDHRVALADDDCAGGLLGHPAGLERDLAAGDLHGDPCNGVAAHIVCLPVRPSVGGLLSFYLCSERRSLAELGPSERPHAPVLPDMSGAGGIDRQPLRRSSGRRGSCARRQIGRRGRLVAPAHDPVGADDHERALREAALVQHAEGRAGRALGLEVRELRDAHAELLAERFCDQLLSQETP